MWEHLKGLKEWAVATHGSHTLILARAQATVGSLWVALSSTDLSPFITDRKQFGYWLIGSAFVNDQIRRYKEDWNADQGDKK